MPIFFTALANLLVSMFGHKVGTRLLFRVPLLLAGITLMVSLTVTYLVFANGLVDGIRQSVPAVVSNVWGWVMPENAFQCLTAIYIAKLSRWVYMKGFDLFKMKTKVMASN
jgi:hypothetical protein